MRRKLTLSQKIRGIRGALASPRTPEQLRKPLQRQLRRLESTRPSKLKPPKKRNLLKEFFGL